MKNEIIALPTWMATRLFLLSNKKHPLYNKKISLIEWYQNRKILCKLFDYVGWFYILVLLPIGVIRAIIGT